jgi:hypothetical protein
MTGRSMVPRALLTLLALAGAACQKEETTITAPALGATCEAAPGSGAAPLTVSFVLGVSGAAGPFTVGVSYGDGQSGGNPDLPHTYGAPGSYTASFTVSTATQSARCATTVAVLPANVGPSPPPSGNLPPEAVFKSTPGASGHTIAGTAPLAVTFNMCATGDPEGDPLFFWMDFQGDGKFEVHGTTGASCRRENVYAAGTWKPLLCVTDLGPAGEELHPQQCQPFTVAVTP